MKNSISGSHRGSAEDSCLLESDALKMGDYFNYFNNCTTYLLLFCTVTNKCTITSQIIILLHVWTL